MHSKEAKQHNGKQGGLNFVFTRHSSNMNYALALLNLKIPHNDCNKHQNMPQSVRGQDMRCYKANRNFVK